MNETTKENTDRFHEPVAKEYKEVLSNVMLLEYAPEPPHMIDAIAKKFKFTVGKKYPVIEKNENFNTFNCKAAYQISTINDENVAVWIDEKYFINPESNLMHWDTKTDSVMKDWDSHFPDIRKVAAEKNIQPIEVLDDGLKYHPDLEKPIPCKTICFLSGLSESEYERLPKHEAYSSDYKIAKFVGKEKEEKVAEVPNEPLKRYPTFYEGIVKDTGNALMDNASLCAIAIDRVFGMEKLADPDGIIIAVRKLMMRSDLSFHWKDETLCVGDIKTKITYESVQSAYGGLKKMVSTKTAQRLVAKMIANKLKKVF